MTGLQHLASIFGLICILAKSPREEALSKRYKGCKMPPKAAFGFIFRRITCARSVIL